MQNPPPVQSGKSSTGLDENVAALLSYIFGWITGLIFFLIEKNSQLVRFHAMQAILYNVSVGVLLVAFYIVFFVLILIVHQISDVLGTIFGLLMWLLGLALSVGI